MITKVKELKEILEHYDDNDTLICYRQDDGTEYDFCVGRQEEFDNSDNVYIALFEK